MNDVCLRHKIFIFYAIYKIKMYNLNEVKNMSEIKTIEIKKSIFNANEIDANNLRKKLKEKS